MSHLQDDRANESVDRSGEGLGDPGSLETPQHDPPFAEDGEEIQHLAKEAAFKQTKGGQGDAPLLIAGDA